VSRTHSYDISVTWTGNRGTGTSGYLTVASADMIEKATTVHGEAHAMCFIANSVNFPVRHEPAVTANG